MKLPSPVLRTPSPLVGPRERDGARGTLNGSWSLRISFWNTWLLLNLWGRHSVCRFRRHPAARTTDQGCSANRHAGKPAPHRPSPAFISRFKWIKWLFNSIAGVAFLLTGSGCLHSHSNFYPLGIYSVPTTNDLRTVQQVGFNLVAGSAEKSYLDTARSLGLKILASPNTSAGRDFNALAARRAVVAFDSHPALWGWYLVDEPDLNGIPPADVAAAHRFVKRAGARKPTVLTLYQGAAALHYANIADITMVDRYPIPWLPLANFPQHVRMARLALGKRKPLIAVIQAFDWSYYPKELEGEKNLRAPTYDESRCMTYCALAQRATGLLYFCFDSGPWKIMEHPEVWEALKRVISEVNERLPLFQAEHQWWPVTHEFGDPSIRFNRALDSSITSVWLKVKRGNPKVPPGEYILTVNNTEKKQVYTFALPRPLASSLRVAQPLRPVASRNIQVPRSPGKLRSPPIPQPGKATLLDWNASGNASISKRITEHPYDTVGPAIPKPSLPNLKSEIRNPKFAGASPRQPQHLRSSPRPANSGAGRSLNGIMDVFGEPRSVAVLNNWVTDTFEPYAVHIYGPLAFESHN